MNYEELIEGFRNLIYRKIEDDCYKCDWLEDAIKAIESLQKENDELRIILDMYGGEEGITETFKKAEQLDGALEDLCGLCWCCKNGKRWDKASPLSKATTCEYMSELGILARSGGKCKCSHWEWRGIEDK